VLDPGRLMETTRSYAADVLAGRFPQLRFDAERRWHERIYQDAQVDVWLLSWLPTQRTLLHDHDGSSGAFTVVQGELSEAVYAPRRGADALSEIRRSAGESVGFGARYVHDVRNRSDAPAVSVHAYSAPLTLMTYYELADRALVRLGTVETDDPEAEFDRTDFRHRAAS